ncbi:DUF3800 domain-containing protein [Bradyrhizobium sp. 157]|uniref:DUF3800 domain-containing protein n=1 Tax=Bradyrhizobium sp. 157 TaxID=2782631 RepID=UPI001FF85950|nr:DUF3800 domain-containing protein [Bradyrhizobium sp. 157]MCK1640179.1 DUF3800 domain-containing protein [Bradyrhizobium sp. 157]
MGESKIPIYAYVDESGNTGKNIFDPSQPDYFAGALIAKGDFDIRYTDHIQKIAGKVGVTAIHANELGLGKLETIAADLYKLLSNANTQFFVSRVEKKYLLATKMFDVLFDSGENAAVAWHHYNFKPLRIILAFKLSHIIDDSIARDFWKALLMARENDARNALPPICEALKSRLETLPDQKSREVLGGGLDWIIKHPECVQFATEQQIAKKGHFPNLVAFSNLLQGLQHVSQLSKKKIACITHDEQSEFERIYESWHKVFSNASSEVIEWAGERYSLQWAPGSRFVMKPDDSSVGIQMADVALWLYGQSLKGKNIPRNCAKLLALMLERGWRNDFSFVGVESHLIENYGEILFGELPPEKMDAAQKMLIMAEERRRVSMEEFEADGVPPFARPVGVVENSQISDEST